MNTQILFKMLICRYLTFHIQMFLCLYRLSKENRVKEAETTMAAVESKLPYLLRYLGDEDDDVSGACVDFASEYISLLKTLGPLTEGQRKHVEVGHQRRKNFFSKYTPQIVN